MRTVIILGLRVYGIIGSVRATISANVEAII